MEHIQGSGCMRWYSEPPRKQDDLYLAFEYLGHHYRIGHGNGDGDLATTQNYLNKSQKRLDEINDKLAEMYSDDDGGLYA